MIITVDLNQLSQSPISILEIREFINKLSPETQGALYGILFSVFDLNPQMKNIVDLNNIFLELERSWRIAHERAVLELMKQQEEKKNNS